MELQDKNGVSDNWEETKGSNNFKRDAKCLPRDQMCKYFCFALYVLYYIFRNKYQKNAI